MESEQVEHIKHQLDLIIDLLRLLLNARPDPEMIAMIERRIRELRYGGY